MSEPCARKAPRQADSASQVAPETTCGRQTPDRAAAAVDEPRLTGQLVAARDHADHVPGAAAQTGPGAHHDLSSEL